MLKLLVVGEFPAWVGVVYWGAIGAVAAGLAYVISNHVSISFH